MNATPSAARDVREQLLRPAIGETYKAYLQRIGPMSGLPRNALRKAIKAMLADAKTLGIEPSLSAVKAVQIINDKGEEAARTAQGEAQ